ncbi:MAG: ATP-binding protein [Actinomycetota bacterium]
MTSDGSGRDEEMTLLSNRLAVAEETLRALLGGEVDSIVMDTGQGERQIFTLETEERPYRHLVERMSEGAALADAEGVIVYANQRLATLLGVPLERLLGRPFSDWLDESDRSLFIRRIADEGSDGHEEHTLRRVDGGRVPVLVGVSVTQEPDGLLRCLTVTDLSPLKAQQRQMDRLNTELRDRLAELHQVNGELDIQRIRVEEANAELQVVNGEIRGFTAAAAHDLRSPLASIVGFSALLTENWENFTEENRQSFVASIDRQSKNLARLVDDLFTMSSIEGGALPTTPEPVALGEAIARCLELGSGDDAGVAVSCSPDLIVRVDPQHLARILDNYLQNALKYGEKPVSIEASRAGEMVQVRVLDQGPGVPPDFLPRLFGRFTRADTQATKAHKGSGLGLSIVRGLAEANGGHVRYEANVPVGSCFVVELPAVSSEGESQI